jgi:hypothetical protein
MLSLVVGVPMKRRTLLERLHLCRKEKIIKESYFLEKTGEINIYKIYHFSKKAFWDKEKLQKALKENLYCSFSQIPNEYLKEAVILKLIETLKKEKGKTVFLNKNLCNTPHLAQICRYSKRVYIDSDTLPNNAEEIYKNIGTLPFLSSCANGADIIPDTNIPFFVKLPKEVEEIRPKEFSPTLFAGLIFKENGMLII